MVRKNQITRAGLFCLLLSLNMSPENDEVSRRAARERATERAQAAEALTQEAKKATERAKAAIPRFGNGDVTNTQPQRPGDSDAVSSIESQIKGDAFTFGR